MDLTFIEVMPMGDMGNEDRLDQYWSLKDLRARWRAVHPDRSGRAHGGPARYVRLEENGQKIGFITPLTHNFCESCNRVRLTCTGELYMCLGQEDMADLRAPLRASDETRRWNRRSVTPSRASPRAMISTIRAAVSPGRSAAI
jgi:GTP 3',8-cyclase